MILVCTRACLRCLVYYLVLGMYFLFGRGDGGVGLVSRAVCHNEAVMILNECR